MSQVTDVAPHRMAGSAAAAIKPAQPGSLHNVDTPALVDEHRGQGHAKRRAAERIELIEAELERRGVTEAKGKTSAIRRLSNDGLIDLARLRADHPELVARYRRPGSEHFFRSRALTAEERA